MAELQAKLYKCLFPRGSVPLTNGSGSCSFRQLASDLQDANQK
jgi:hypothetical protein